jgi:hypothetical protein
VKVSGSLNLYGLGKLPINGTYDGGVGGNAYSLKWSCNSCPKVFTQGSATLTVKALDIDINRSRIKFNNGRGCLERDNINLCPLNVNAIDLKFSPDWAAKKLTVCPLNTSLSQVCVTF